MNPATKNILRSIIQKFGADIAYDSRLCDAYLSDLIPDFPTERHLLVNTVKNGLTAQLITDPSESNISSLVFQFAQAHNLPFQHADNLLRTWVFAFQGQIHTKFRSRPQKTNNYLQALVAGVVVLVISSAIAFYQPPELHIPSQTNTTALNPDDKKNLVDKEKPPKSTTQEIPSIPEPEQKRDTEFSNETSLVLSNQTPPPEKQIPESEHNKTDQKTAQSSVPEKPETATKTIKGTPTPALVKSNSLPVKAESTINYLVSESILFLVNTDLLNNKKSDLQNLINSSEITQDEFYTEQQENVTNTINNIKKELDLSVNRYIKKLQELCQLDEKNHLIESRAHLSTEAQSHIEKSAINALQQHIKNCANKNSLNAENIKNELIDLAGKL